MRRSDLCHGNLGSKVHSVLAASEVTSRCELYRSPLLVVADQGSTRIETTNKPRKLKPTHMYSTNTSNCLCFIADTDNQQFPRQGKLGLHN